MSRSLGRRIERLERDTHVDDADIDRARAICRAYEVVKHHPEEATDEDRALAAVTSKRLTASHPVQELHRFAVEATKGLLSLSQTKRDWPEATNRLNLLLDERPLPADLVRADRILPIARLARSRNPGAAPSAQSHPNAPVVG
jgi:hypothetical protein